MGKHGAWGIKSIVVFKVSNHVFVLDRSLILGDRIGRRIGWCRISWRRIGRRRIGWRGVRSGRIDRFTSLLVIKRRIVISVGQQEAVRELVRDHRRFVVVRELKHVPEDLKTAS